MTDNGNPFREDEMYCTKDVMRVCKISRSTVLRWVQSGYLPKPVAFQSGPRWPGRHLIAWYDQQARAVV